MRILFGGLCHEDNVMRILFGGSWLEDLGMEDLVMRILI